jgi:hypothetical protein
VAGRGPTGCGLSVLHRVSSGAAEWARHALGGFYYPQEDGLVAARDVMPQVPYLRRKPMVVVEAPQLCGPELWLWRSCHTPPLPYADRCCPSVCIIYLTAQRAIHLLRGSLILRSSPCARSRKYRTALALCSKASYVECRRCVARRTQDSDKRIGRIVAPPGIRPPDRG